MTTITEADVEQVALVWLSGLGLQMAHGPDIVPDTPGAEQARVRWNEQVKRWTYGSKRPANSAIQPPSQQTNG